MADTCGNSSVVMPSYAMHKRQCTVECCCGAGCLLHSQWLQSLNWNPCVLTVQNLPAHLDQTTCWQTSLAIYHTYGYGWAFHRWSCCPFPGKSSYHRLDVVVRGISTGRTNNIALPFCYPFMVNDNPGVGARVASAIMIQGVAVAGHFIGGYLGNPFYAISSHFTPLTNDG